MTPESSRRYEMVMRGMSRLLVRPRVDRPPIELLYPKLTLAYSRNTLNIPL